MRETAVTRASIVCKQFVAAAGPAAPKVTTPTLAGQWAGCITTRIFPRFSLSIEFAPKDLFHEQCM
jgi:hypothetical protein